MAPKVQVQGSVVIAPPIGREGTIAFRAMKALAVQAAEAGFVAVRFDWTHTGESARRPAGRNLVDCWEEDLSAALALAEELVPGARPHLVGVRLAATLAARVPTEGLASRVLWEPIAGRAFLRFQTTLRQLGIAVPTVPEGAELVGLWLTDEERAAVRTLRAPDGPDVIREASPAALATFVEAEPQEAEVPWATIRRIVTGLDAGDFRAADWRPTPTTKVLVAEGVEVEESFVETRPLGLPGVLTRPIGRAPVAGVAFAPGGSDPRSGPAHLWVDAGRSLAARGIVTLRTDRRGQGELMDTGATRPPSPTQPNVVTDTVETIDHLRAAVPGVPLLAVGLCSGAWSSVLAARRTRVDRVVAFNNLAWKPTGSAYARPGRSGSPALARGPHEPRAEAAEPADAPDRRTEMCHRLQGARIRLRTSPWRNRALRGWEHTKTAATRHAPMRAWRAAAMYTSLEFPGLLLPENSPTSYRFHMGHEDAADFCRRRGPEAFAGLLAAGLDIHARTWDDLDHGVLGEVSRRRVLEIVHAEVDAALASATTAPPSEDLGTKATP